MGFWLRNHKLASSHVLGHFGPSFDSKRLFDKNKLFALRSSGDSIKELTRMHGFASYRRFGTARARPWQVGYVFYRKALCKDFFTKINFRKNGYADFYGLSDIDSVATDFDPTLSTDSSLGMLIDFWCA
ncbi:hypothetical protein IGI04_019954, partial [Brassica rapa subsp. trilocularis]